MNEYPEKFSDDNMVVNRIGMNLEEAEDRLRNEVEGIHAIRIKGVVPSRFRLIGKTGHRWNQEA